MGTSARRRAEAGIEGSWWGWLRPLGGAAIVVGVVVGLGVDTIVHTFGTVSTSSLVQGGAAGVVIIAVTTACGAWRWQLVARQLHVELSLQSAIVACYRSQFLNLALPGGVLGDLGRGMQHGRAVDDLGVGLRAVAWERGAGQVVLAGVTLPLLLVVRPFSAPFPVGPWWVLAVAAGLCVVLIWAARDGRPVVQRLVQAARADARSVLSPPALAGILVASILVVAGHAATFVVAARAVGVHAPVVELLPLALVVLLASAVPLHLAGWGPREGAAAWTFTAAGLGATDGVAVAVAFGAIVLVATLPGALLLARRSQWSRSSVSRSSVSRSSVSRSSVPRSAASLYDGARAHADCSMSTHSGERTARG